MLRARLYVTHLEKRVMIPIKRIAVLLVIAFVVVVFGTFAFQFYRNHNAANNPERQPEIIFERTDRPSRA